MIAVKVSASKFASSISPLACLVSTTWTIVTALDSTVSISTSVTNVLLPSDTVVAPPFAKLSFAIAVLTARATEELTIAARSSRD